MDACKEPIDQDFFNDVFLSTDKCHIRLLGRNGQKGEIGFLSDIRRMNVGMTRARRKLLLVGDSSTLCRHPFLWSCWLM